MIGCPCALVWRASETGNPLSTPPRLAYRDEGRFGPKSSGMTVEGAAGVVAPNFILQLSKIFVCINGTSGLGKGIIRCTKVAPTSSDGRTGGREIGACSFGERAQESNTFRSQIILLLTIGAADMVARYFWSICPGYPQLFPLNCK
jgi:hypothetical protein